MLDFSGRWLGLIVVCTGICILLLAGVPRENGSSSSENWRDRFGKALKATGLIAVLLGTLQLSGLIFKSSGSSSTLPLGHSFPPGMIVHRHNAGTLGADGWCEGDSTRGNFSVEVPGTYDDYTLETGEETGNKVTIYGVGATIDNSLSFTVHQEVRPANLPYPSPEELEEQEKPLLQGKPRKFMLDGIQGVELQTANAGHGKYTRYLRLRNSSITMTLEFPPEKSIQAAELAERFLNSLKLQNASK